MRSHFSECFFSLDSVTHATHKTLMQCTYIGVGQTQILFFLEKCPRAASHTYIFFHSVMQSWFLFPFFRWQILNMYFSWSCQMCNPLDHLINQCNVSHLYCHIYFFKASFTCPYFLLCTSSFIYTIYSLWENKVKMKKFTFSNQKK